MQIDGHLIAVICLIALIGRGNVNASNYDRLIAELNARNQQHHDLLYADPVARMQLQKLYAATDGPYQMLMGDSRDQPKSGVFVNENEAAGAERDTTGPRLEKAVPEIDESLVGSANSLANHVISSRDWELFKQELSKMQPIPSRRQPEQIDQPNHLQGELKVQAGNAKGVDAVNQLQLAQSEEDKSAKLVKSDAKLPAYCNPPNPCPAGVDPDTAQSPCDKHIPDTKRYQKDYNAAQILSGQCTCDNEHMKNKCQGLTVEDSSEAFSRKTANAKSEAVNGMRDSEVNELNNLPEMSVNDGPDYDNKVDAIPQSRLDNVAAQLDLIESLDRPRSNRIRQLLKENPDQND